MTQADSAEALRRSLDSAPEPSDSTPDHPTPAEHPSLTYLRNHCMRCDRCAVGAACATGASLLRTWTITRAEIAAEKAERLARAEIAKLKAAAEEVAGHPV